MANPGKMSTDESLWLAGLHVLQLTTKQQWRNSLFYCQTTSDVHITQVFPRILVVQYFI